MSTITIHLGEEKLKQLQSKAQELNISVEELLEKVLSDLVESPRADFNKVMRYVLDKNRELYKRLA
jgi:hypothetical protein